MDSIQVIEINSEIGAGRRGASLGIQAIKIASLNSNSSYFFNMPIIKVPDENHLLFEANSFEKDRHAKRIKGVINVCTNLSNAVKGVLNDEKFPIVLSGDHSSSGGTIAGIKAAFPDKRLGVIWIDAHADLHSPFTSPSGNMHGMPLAASLGEDNLEKKKNEVSESTAKDWSTLKNLQGISPKIRFEDIVFVGVRDTEEEEDFLIEKNNVKKISVPEVRVKGVHNIVNEINDYMMDCDLIYVSFDVDSLDCDYVSQGTGTPVEKGFDEDEIIGLLNGLLTNEKVCCFETTEINPTLDEKRNLMAEVAFNILDEATTVLEERD